LEGRRRKWNWNGDREEGTGKQLPEFIPGTRDPRSGLRVLGGGGLPARARWGPLPLCDSDERREELYLRNHNSQRLCFNLKMHQKTF